MFLRIKIVCLVVANVNWNAILRLKKQIHQNGMHVTQFSKHARYELSFFQQYFGN